MSRPPIEDAEQAREMVEYGLEWLVEFDGYTVTQLRENLLDDILAYLERESE